MANIKFTALIRTLNDDTTSIFKSSKEWTEIVYSNGLLKECYKCKSEIAIISNYLNLLCDMGFIERKQDITNNYKPYFYKVKHKIPLAGENTPYTPNYKDDVILSKGGW
jgi:hypothetical protein